MEQFRMALTAFWTGAIKDRMATPKQFLKDYPQAPWRKQTQFGAVLLLVAVLITSILWVMLSVTVQAGAIALDNTSLQSNREDLQRSITDLRTQHAQLTSALTMSSRAADLGFVPLDPNNVTYMVVPGYTGRLIEIDSLISYSTPQTRPLVKPAYTQSLWDWMTKGVTAIENRTESITP